MTGGLAFRPITLGNGVCVALPGENPATAKPDESKVFRTTRKVSAATAALMTPPTRAMITSGATRPGMELRSLGG
jgi:hypothetical protein